MAQSRRAAFRVRLEVPGTLSFSRRTTECLVIDVSATGARVRISPPALVPDRVTLATEIAGYRLELPARLRRSELESIVALAFEGPESAALHRALHEAQRREIPANRSAY